MEFGKLGKQGAAEFEGDSNSKLGRTHPKACHARRPHLKQERATTSEHLGALHKGS